MEAGVMIYNLRKEVGIAQKDLCRGIFNIAEYSRIERGEQETDKFINGYVRYIDKERMLHQQSLLLLEEVRNYVEKGKKDETIRQMEKIIRRLIGNKE